MDIMIVIGYKQGSKQTFSLFQLKSIHNMYSLQDIQLVYMFWNNFQSFFIKCKLSQTRCLMQIESTFCL